MSTWFPEQVTCPSCGHEQTALLAHGVHIARAPEIRDQLFARTFHAVTCKSCSMIFIAQRPLIYTDMDRKHWVQVMLEDERPRWPELEPMLDKVYERAFTGSPLARKLTERMTLRLVFGLEELREKLVIWEANLSDAAMECLKIELVRQDPSLVRHTLLVDAIGPNHSMSIRVDGRDPIVVDGALVDRFDDDSRLEDRFPELFGGRYVNVHRLTGPRYRWAEPS